MLVVSIIRWLRVYVLPILFGLFIAVLGTFLYVRAEKLMADQLRQRLQSTATVAASQVDVSDVLDVRSETDAGSPAHARLVEHLRRIRSIVPGVRYAYLVRATDDPSTVAFIADADELRTFDELDLDADGALDDDEIPSHLGETYAIDGMDAFAKGFRAPSVDAVPTSDRWGRLISGYAPVHDAAGATVAVLGIDMNADEFLDIARSVFSPLVFVLVALAAALLTFFSFSVVQRRRYESLRQLEAERSALLDLATHQIGMPLATFRWWLEILRDKKDRSEGDLEAYEQLQVGVDRMDHIIRSLQDAAKLQAASATFNSERVDPAALVDEAVASMQSAFALKQQRIEVVREDVPDILADRKPMAGVLAELLENARGYSPAGSVVTVRVAKTRAGVRIEVEDRGCGIPAEHIPRMFQKFTRGVNAYAHKPVGNGLGLYICKGIVERARGKISVKSVEGKGTTVALEFPAAA